MTSLQHLLWFLYLGLSWGIVPVLYRLLADARVPVSHTVVLSGIGVGITLYLFDGLRKGNWIISRPVLVFSILCAICANLPFALNLTAAAHISPATMALIVSTTPLVNYAIALVTGWEQATSRRLLAIVLGFVSTVILLLPGSEAGHPSDPLWLAAAMSLPFFYCLYSNFAARKWPRGAEAGQIAAIESGLGGILAIPFLLAFAPLRADDGPELHAYWLIVAAVAMWVIERIGYFTLIKERGAVYTGQASYIATPSAVILSAWLFGTEANKGVWVSLGLLMLALYLNNTGREPRPQAATQPNS